MNVILDQLKAEGRANLPPLSAEQTAEVNAHLHNRPVYQGFHVSYNATKRGYHSVPRYLNQSEVFCGETWDTLSAPHVFERALALTDIAAAYLDKDPPVLYYTNTFWTKPGREDPNKKIQVFHVDRDDTRFLALFIYLTDVLVDEDGPQDLQGPDNVIRTMYGPAGTMFLADTSRLHRGRKPTSHERGLMWFRWGVSDRPAANVQDQVQPIGSKLLGDRYPTDKRLQQSIKLLVTNND